MREYRFLVPPTMAYLTWVSASYFYGKPIIFWSSSPVGFLISVPAIGYLISQISVFAINVCDEVFVPFIFLIKRNGRKPYSIIWRKFCSKLKQFFSYKCGTFYFMDVERKDYIVGEMYPFLRKEKILEVNRRIWFAENMKLGQNELSKWLERRWSMVMTNLNTFVALLFAWVLFLCHYEIAVFAGSFFYSLIMIAIILILNLAKAWKDIRLVESYFFENYLNEQKRQETD